MAVRVPCPSCGTEANVEEQSLGRRGRCKKCGHVFALARTDASARKVSTPGVPVNLPEQFGRYRIMKPLGQGGMGAVYLAHDTNLDRQVALKVPFFDPADGPEAIQRFEREARSAATLNHPNLCPIFDVGDIDGVHYLTMPYIKGKTLSEKITLAKTFPEAMAAAMTSKLALALQEAHATGIIHRDLKLANIMVNHRGEMVIMDFGLARALGGDDVSITRTGRVLGTALYMSPEQAAGDVNAIRPASDVYSLGVILYELLTGRYPFEGSWPLVIGLKNALDPAPPSKHRSGLDPTIDAICLKAIARKPEDRYPTMAKFAEALNSYSTNPSSMAARGINENRKKASSASVSGARMDQPANRAAKNVSRERPPIGGEPSRPPARPPEGVKAKGGSATSNVPGVGRTEDESAKQKVRWPAIMLIITGVIQTIF